MPRASANTDARSPASSVPSALTAFHSVLANVATDAIQAFINEAGKRIASQAHTSRLLDRAGRPGAKNIAVLANTTPFFQTPCYPELNATERLWLHVEERCRSLGRWPDHDSRLLSSAAAYQRYRQDQIAILQGIGAFSQTRIAYGIIALLSEPARR